MDNKKKSITILVIGIIALLLIVGGASFAYFVATGGTPKDMDITVTTNTVDKLDFQVGDDINIFASPDNFGNGQGNQSGNSYARAILTPNNKTNNATAHYYLYLNITKNELEYTTLSHKAELMLTVTDEDDNIVTIADLPEVKDGDNNVIGYDITEEEGLITILNNHEIVASGTTTENWNVTVTFINLPDNQNDNTGKLFTAKVLIQEEKIEFFASYIVNQFQSNTTNTNGLYHHDGTITSTSVGLDFNNKVLDANDDSYRYSGPNSLVTNYVCFGYDDATGIYAPNWCPANNIYRIIGVFGDRVKLIKNTIATSELLGTDGDYGNSTQYYWNKKNYNLASTETGYYHVWSYSELNTINLNTNYLNNIDGSVPGSWSNKIDETTWCVNGGTTSQIYNGTANSAYNAELGEASRNATGTFVPYRSKIGLMYASDYGYAAYPSAWNTKLGYPGYSNQTIKDNNWMFLDTHEWTVSRRAGYSDYAFVVVADGYVFNDNVNYMYAVRPSFNLKSSTTYAGGTGSASDPYRIN